jgi:hypothetical protein
MMKIFIFCLGLLFAAPGYADTCKYEDADGRIIYTNIPIKGAKKISCFGFEGGAGTSSGGGARENRVRQPTPAGFPRVESNVQRQRDDARRRILEEELEAEKRALDDAKRAYAEGEADPETFRTTVAGKNGKPQTVVRRNVAAYEEKMKRLQEGVDLHQKNIEMLEKELAGLK